MKNNENDQESITLKTNLSSSPFSFYIYKKINKKKKQDKLYVIKSFQPSYLIYMLLIFFILISIIIFIKKHNISKEENKNEKFKNMNILLIGAPFHYNIGDHAILLAEIKFIQENFPGINITILYENDNYNKIDHLVNNKTLIICQGGGTLNDLYKRPEKIRRTIINKYPNNYIIIFPQTIYFKQFSQIKITSEIYNKHKKLILIAREKISYEIMKSQFPNNTVIYTPDLVTYCDDNINNEIKSKKRRGVLFILRNDKEILLSKKNKNKLISISKKYIDNVLISDNEQINKTGINLKSLKSSNKMVKEKLDEILKAQIVITDRLHGMIFCAITETSCIVLGNSHHKVQSSAEWFSHLDYIKFLENINNFENTFTQLLNKKTKNHYDKTYFSKYYLLIYNQILKALKND